MLSGSANAQELPPSLEEDFQYPGSAGIFADTGVRLLSGDGHIQLSDCLGDGSVIRVQSLSASEACFRVSALPGTLHLEMPDVFLIYRGGTPLAAELRVDGERQSLQLRPQWNPVGAGLGLDPVESVLLTLRAVP
jgi:hypothetical protein